MVRLKIEAMTCGGCAKSITKAIESVDPKAKIDVDIEGRLVTVDSTTNVNSLIEVIHEAGYEATMA